jgi:hypothetical protein
MAIRGIPGPWMKSLIGRGLLVRPMFEDEGRFGLLGAP